MACIVVLLTTTVLGRVGCLILTSVGNVSVGELHYGWPFGHICLPLFVLELRDGESIIVTQSRILAVSLSENSHEQLSLSYLLR